MQAARAQAYQRSFAEEASQTRKNLRVSAWVPAADQPFVSPQPAVPELTGRGGGLPGEGKEQGGEAPARTAPERRFDLTPTQLTSLAPN